MTPPTFINRVEPQGKNYLSFFPEKSLLSNSCHVVLPLRLVEEREGDDVEVEIVVELLSFRGLVSAKHHPSPWLVS